MLEQKTETNSREVDDFTLIIEKSRIIEYEESSIDETEPLYLFTWSPDPKEMPDSDFYVQHQVNIDLLANYLAVCSCGLVCVESTQMGNPHYHGWYQIDPVKETARISLIKTINRYGMLKISQARSFRIFSWKKHANCLYYYKKDSMDSMLRVPDSIITKDSKSICQQVNFDIIGFFSKDRRVHRMIKDKISDREFYRRFYSNTLKEMQCKDESQDWTIGEGI